MQFCAGHLPLCVTHTHTHTHMHKHKSTVFVNSALHLRETKARYHLSPLQLGWHLGEWRLYGGYELVYRPKDPVCGNSKKGRGKQKKKQLGNLNDRDWKETFYSLAFFFPWCATKLVGWTQTETWKAMACTLHIWLPKHSRTRTIYCDCFMLTLNPLGWLKYCQIGRDFWEQVLLLVE